ncbi:hypothetical protein E4P82_16365 [Candidatus Competibacter phosphatis]|uniref:Transposase n=1 Tax=Candidatus Competibacter phosphatis TaxID=221280 RepID=A0ABX1TQ30_9GAMM|nr:hypothetical protein [Candidatus Competibacter phosphatis]NMQ20629.1 hypothetical protein [Candidatus Competibacter phosphatis]
MDVAALSRELAALPAVPPTARPRTQRDLIEQLREPLIEALVDRHYSFAALAEVLSQWGIDIRPDTLRRYLGPVDPNRRVSPRRVSPRRVPPADRPPVGEPSPASAARDPAPNAPPPRGGSPDAIVRLDTAWAETPPEPLVQPPRDPSGERPADPPVAAPGTFTPRPERPIDWYKPSS